MFGTIDLSGIISTSTTVIAGFFPSWLYVGIFGTAIIIAAMGVAFIARRVRGGAKIVLGGGGRRGRRGRR